MSKFVYTNLYIQICTDKFVPTNLYRQDCTYKLQYTNLFFQICRYKFVYTNLYIQIGGRSRLSIGRVMYVYIHVYIMWFRGLKHQHFLSPLKPCLKTRKNTRILKDYTKILTRNSDISWYEISLILCLYTHFEQVCICLRYLLHFLHLLTIYFVFLCSSHFHIFSYICFHIFVLGERWGYCNDSAVGGKSRET